jgi:glycosyltransferase involved in cell wall biosynthesis
MIVKNESQIIEETLKCLIEKARFHYWVICDTGSTDGTQAIIKDTLKDIPGELHEVPWVDFGKNRTQVVELAYGKTDYAFMFDADDTIEGDSIPFPSKMTADVYEVLFRCVELEFHRSSIFNNRRRWRYVGVLHEYLENTDGDTPTRSILKGNYKCIARTIGARSKDPERFRKDALVLANAFENTTDYIRNRYAFYCANSYRDCGMWTDALKWYNTVLTLNGWTEERYMACKRIYEIYSIIGTPELGMYALVESYSLNRDRVECANYLINYYLLKGHYDVAFKYYELLNPDFEKSDTSTYLMAEPFVRNFLFPYNVIILSDKVKRHDIGLKMYSFIFNNKTVPDNHFYIKHLLGNLKFFMPYIRSENKTSFYKEVGSYKRLCVEKGFNEV